MKENVYFYNKVQSKKFTEKVNPFKLYSPTLQLSGHKSEVLCGKFSNNGLFYCTGGGDKNIKIWDIFDNCKNVNDLIGHSNAIMDICFNEDDNILISASADKCVMIWDLYKGVRIKKIKDHSNVVYNVDCKDDIVLSSSEDNKSIFYDIRSKDKKVINHKYQILSSVFGNDDKIYFGGIDNLIHVYNLKMDAIEFTISGHNDTILCLRYNRNNNSLLSNSIDGEIKMWKMNNFDCTTYNIPDNKNVFTKCCWKNNEEFCISENKNILIFNSKSLISSNYSGHEGIINEIDYNKQFSIIGTVSSDHTAIIGEK